MALVSAKTKDIETIIRETVDVLVQVRRASGGFFVNLPLVYPDGSCVTVRIDEIQNGLRVSDFGLAFREAEDVGHAKSFRRTANRIVEGAGLVVGDRMVARDTTADQLHGAICDVAEASWRIANEIALRASEEEEALLSEELNDRLVKLFGETNVARESRLRGVSAIEWAVSSVVTTAGRPAVFQAVSHQANSLYKAATAFRDLAGLETAPKLIAVVKNKQELGNRLALLSPGLVLERTESDSHFVRAAA